MYERVIVLSVDCDWIMQVNVWLEFAARKHDVCVRYDRTSRSASMYFPQGSLNRFGLCADSLEELMWWQAMRHRP